MIATKTMTERKVTCPSCDKKGKRVKAITLLALLNDEHAKEMETEQGDSWCKATATDDSGCTSTPEGSGWRFCSSPECEIVYFAENTTRQFSNADLKVPVGIKETTGERPLCYCFGHSVETIKKELNSQGGSDALEDIRKKMQDPGCRCETENPSGSCCLGNVAKGIQIAAKEVNINDPVVAMVAKTPSGRAEVIAKVGTVLSAIMASSCCWLPLLLLAMGVSGAGIASTLEAYRPLFIVVTVGFLGAAFYFTYRPRKAATIGGGEDCCAPKAAKTKDCCAPAGKRRFSMMTLNKVMLWVVTVMAVALLFFPSYVGALLGTNNSQNITAEMKQAVFKIEGMTCEGCSATVAQAIRSVPGLQGVSVNYEKQEAVVGVGRSQSVPTNEILAALKRAGYSGKISDPGEK